eukprot:TRINITY_DN5830_c0_g1_i1.p1 TRINITY_DN5830_c0_g1~~TRINITY_DN5830_c0_g1_i1.p1  ORF type:complete len:223 (-),score=32.10 TRINITY_DN5830_c0_g1_i1:98-766(-)
MAIILGLVAQRRTVLCHEGPLSKFKKIIHGILEEFDDFNQLHRKSYVYDEYSYNVLIENGYTFMCIADRDHKTRICFAMLYKIRELFQPAAASRFGRVIKDEMTRYSNSAEVDKLSALHAELDEVKDIMKENLRAVFERGQKLDDLLILTEEIDIESLAFKRSAVSLERAMWWRNIRLWLIIGAIVLFIILIIVLSACGITFSKCSSGGLTPSPSGNTTSTM